jgi:two-component sensor histidine kinase
MGALMRAFDWDSSTLGRPENWPPSLRVTVRLVLNTRHPMFIWWGPDLIQFYNDAYRQTMGPERHPSALGGRGRECWAEIWHIIGPQIEYVMAGKGSTWDEDRLVPVTRHGHLENVWWTYSYGPIDVDGGVGGVLVICNDVTLQHLANEALKNQTRYLERLFEQAPGFMAVLRGPEHVFELTNVSYRQLVGDRDFIGRSVREVIPEIEGQGIFELLDEVYRTGNAHVGKRVPVTLESGAEGSPKKMLLDFVYQPIVQADGAVSGIFVEGVDVTDNVRAEQHLRLMNDELQHRVKNTLAVVSAIAAQTLRGTARDPDLRAFQGRLAAFAKAHDGLAANNWATTLVGDVVRDALAPHGMGAERWSISGPDVMLGSKHALSLALAVHELATNSMKYGAWSNERGRVRVSWRAEELDRTPTFSLSWQESDGPLVTAPTKKGFGSRLIERVWVGDFGGDVEIAYEPSGVICRLSAPMENLRQALPSPLGGPSGANE